MTFPRCHNASGKPCEFSQVCPQRRQETAQKFAAFEGITLEPKRDCTWWNAERLISAGYHPPVEPRVVIKHVDAGTEAARERDAIQGEGQ